MSESLTGDPQRLVELRAKIDAIDESVHRLLMQRATVIDTLIEVKGTARNGAAFRPGREASMMHELVVRHGGHLPVTAVEHLWREIISTFTALQAPFSVHATPMEGDLMAAVDTARFYFGFSVPLLMEATAQDVVATIEAGGDKLGILPLEGLYPWWQGLRKAQIVCRLPFIEAENRPAGRPAVVIAPPLADPASPDITCYRVDGLSAMAPVSEGLTILSQAPYGTGLFSALVATREGVDAITARLGHGLDIAPVGGYAPTIPYPNGVQTASTPSAKL
ncbi:MAG: chorismate mutase [Pseudomonadota bacterium]|nr:chorismate mutase [Pseudomonadota bacterium]